MNEALEQLLEELREVRVAMQDNLERVEKIIGKNNLHD